MEEKEEILDIMRKIRFEETTKIVENKLGEEFTNEEFDKLQETDFVKNIKYLGKIEIDGKKQDIYLIIEQIERINENKKKVPVELQKYVTENLEVLAVEDMEKKFGIVPTKTELNQEEKIEQLKQLDKQGILDLNELETKIKVELAEIIGISLNEIEETKELDLKQKIKEPKENNTITEEQYKGMQTKEETLLNQNIKGETLETKLGLKEKGITDGIKLVRVSSHNVNKYVDKKHSQVDSFVVIRKNGEKEVLGEDILEPDNKLGTNPTQENLTINNDGSVKNEKITSSYRIVNRKDEYLTCGYDETFGKEIKYSKYSPQENKYVDVELETQRTHIQANDVRQFMKDKGVGEREAKKILEEDRKHGECPKKDVTVIDTDKNNDSHTHEIIKATDYIPNTKITWERLAKMCGYRGEGSIEKTYEEFISIKKENFEISNNQIINKMEERANEYFPGRKQRGE